MPQRCGGFSRKFRNLLGWKKTKATTTFTFLPFLPVIFPSRKKIIFCDKNSLFDLLQWWLGEGKKLGPHWIFYWRCLSLMRMVSPLRTSRFCLKEILLTWRCLRFFSRHSKQPLVEYTEVLQTKQTKQTKELMSPTQKHIPACNYVRWVTFFGSQFKGCMTMWPVLIIYDLLWPLALQFLRSANCSQASLQPNQAHSNITANFGYRFQNAQGRLETGDIPHESGRSIPEALKSVSQMGKCGSSNLAIHSRKQQPKWITNIHCKHT